MDYTTSDDETMTYTEDIEDDDETPSILEAMGVYTLDTENDSHLGSDATTSEIDNSLELE